MTTKEFIAFTRDQEKRYRIIAGCTDDPAKKVEAKLKAARARKLHAHLRKLWGGDRSLNRAVLPM